MPDPVQLSRGEQASSPQGSVGSGGRLGKGAEKGGHRQKTTDTKRPPNQEERRRERLPTQCSDREGPPACPPKKDKWKQAEESPNLANWPQSGREERDLQDPNVPPRRPRGNHWQMWRSPARRAPRPPRFLLPAAVRPGAVPGQLDQRGQEPLLCFSSNQAPEQPGGGDGCHQRLRPPFTQGAGGGSVEAPGGAPPPKASSTEESESLMPEVAFSQISQRNETCSMNELPISATTRTGDAGGPATVREKDSPTREIQNIGREDEMVYQPPPDYLPPPPADWCAEDTAHSLMAGAQNYDPDSYPSLKTVIKGTTGLVKQSRKRQLSQKSCPDSNPCQETTSETSTLPLSWCLLSMSVLTFQDYVVSHRTTKTRPSPTFLKTTCAQLLEIRTNLISLKTGMDDYDPDLMAKEEATKHLKSVSWFKMTEEELIDPDILIRAIAQIKTFEDYLATRNADLLFARKVFSLDQSMSIREV